MSTQTLRDLLARERLMTDTSTCCCQVVASTANHYIHLVVLMKTVACPKTPVGVDNRLKRWWAAANHTLSERRFKGAIQFNRLLQIVKFALYHANLHMHNHNSRNLLQGGSSVELQAYMFFFGKNTSFHLCPWHLQLAAQHASSAKVEPYYILYTLEITT